MSRLDVIQEIEKSKEQSSDDKGGPAASEVKRNSNPGKGDTEDYRLASMEVLNHVKIKVAPATLESTLKHVWSSKVELSTIEEQIKKAFIEFHQKLRLLKSYR